MTRGRPKKAAVGSQGWARRELGLAEARLRQVRRLIEGASDDQLASLLRLEAALRRECERLARAAQPQVLTDWYAPTRELERVVLDGEEGDDDD